MNNKIFKQLKGSRQQWFESLDKPALMPLPKQTYQYTDIKIVKVNGLPIQYDQHINSVPHHLVGEKCELHAKDRLIELYFHNQRITSHVRRYYPGTTTRPEHMPVRHEGHQKWNAGRLMNWGKDLGVNEKITLLRNPDH